MSRETRRALAYLAIVGAFAFACWGGYKEIQKLDRLAGAVQSGLIEGCQRSGNPGRKATRENLHEEIREVQVEVAKAAQIKPGFFPDIPPATFRRLTKEKLERQNAKLTRKRGRLKHFAPVHCVGQYSR